MKKLSAKAAAMFAVLCLPCMTTFNTYAATVEDAAAVAREYGYTEDEVQQALSEYYANTDYYTEDDIDYAIEKIKSSGKKIVSTVPYNPDATPPVSETTTNTTTATEGEIISDEGNNNSNNNSDNSENGITLTAPDGTKFTRISKEEFIALSYEEKLSYLSTFPIDLQQVIIDNLSPEEYRSMMKQLPAEQKADVINSLA